MIETPSGTRSRRDVLNQAARLIEKRGYTYGSKGMPDSYQNTGELCILGAVALAAGVIVGDEDTDSYDVALDVLGEEKYSGYYYGWNDDLRHRISPEQRAPIVARCLRFMAKGLNFIDARTKAETAEK